MAVNVTGSKTVTLSVAPHLSAAVLTGLLATPMENLTIAQLDQLRDALNRIAKGATPSSTIGSLLS
ncbi:MAG TPA: hypothetical protein VG345_00335 [Bryobacteraceae bacterium]|jgi:hypothetical protein|nr:hypothetical protein [Bryobacteraceae bacterium]